MRTYRYPNKRIGKRLSNGRFAKIQPADLGIMGTCPKCNHFLFRVYDGDPHDQSPDPRRFRSRCLTCEPYSDAEIAREKAYQDAQPKQPSIIDVFKSITKGECRLSLDEEWNDPKERRIRELYAEYERKLQALDEEMK